MGMLSSSPIALIGAALAIAPVVLWLLSQDQARCSICGITQARTMFSKYLRLLVRKNWECMNCRQHFGWWSRERVRVPSGPR